MGGGEGQGSPRLLEVGWGRLLSEKNQKLYPGIGDERENRTWGPISCTGLEERKESTVRFWVSAVWEGGGLSRISNFGSAPPYP